MGVVVFVVSRMCSARYCPCQVNIQKLAKKYRFKVFENLTIIKHFIISETKSLNWIKFGVGGLASETQWGFAYVPGVLLTHADADVVLCFDLQSPKLSSCCKAYSQKMRLSKLLLSLKCARYSKYRLSCYGILEACKRSLPEIKTVVYAVVRVAVYATFYYVQCVEVVSCFYVCIIC